MQSEVVLVTNARGDTYDLNFAPVLARTHTVYYANRAAMELYKLETDVVMTSTFAPRVVRPTMAPAKDLNTFSADGI